MANKIYIIDSESDLDFEFDVCRMPPYGWFLSLTVAILIIFSFLVLFAAGFQICIIGVAIGVVILILNVVKFGGCVYRNRKR